MMSGATMPFKDMFWFWGIREVGHVDKRSRQLERVEDSD